MDFTEKLKGYILKVDECLEKSVAQEDNIQYEIYQAMRYSLFAGGKRLRPVLHLAACEMAGGNIEDALPYAAAIEMIHTYSLIHDDLPAMDDDKLRRGKPTNHIKFGESLAILAGDALLNKSFEIMLNATLKKPHLTQNALRAMALIAESSGTEGMVGGQVADIIAEGKHVDEQYLRYMHSKKTGALMAASVVSGAMIAGANDEKLLKFREFGDKLGLAFQVRDDILDVEGDAMTLGKPIGSDEQNGKSTFVTLLGITECQSLVTKLTVQSVNALSTITTEPNFLHDLAQHLLKRDH